MIDLSQNTDVQWLIEYIFIIDTNKPCLVKHDNLTVLYIYANEFELFFVKQIFEEQQKCTLIMALMHTLLLITF